MPQLTQNGQHGDSSTVRQYDSLVLYLIRVRADSRRCPPNGQSQDVFELVLSKG